MQATCKLVEEEIKNFSSIITCRFESELLVSTLALPTKLIKAFLITLRYYNAV